MKWKIDLVFCVALMAVCIGLSTASFPTAFASRSYTKNKAMFLSAMLLAPCCFASTLTLPTIFSGNMVLQRDQAIKVLTVKAHFHRQYQSLITDGTA